MTSEETAGMRGKVAELLVAAYCMEMGWDVYFPVREDSQCDLLVNMITGSSEWYCRIQVKRIYMKDGYHTINLKRRNGDRYDMWEIELIAAVDVDTREIWLIPFEKLVDKKHGRPLGRLRVTGKWDQYLLEAPHGNDG
jgi:hypothetical protein